MLPASLLEPDRSLLEKYAEMGFVKGGIFKYLRNGMYTVGLLLLWIPGLILCSKGAIIAALFHHIYVWVHYYTVEKPDMDVIYGKN